MNDEMPASKPTTRRRRRVLALVALALAVVAVIQYNVLSRVQGALVAALHWLEHLGWWAPVVFVLLYIASCVGFLPASILTVGAGAAFGVLTGSILVSIGATLGASAAFLVGRYLARDWVRGKIGHRPAFIAIDKAVAEEGWKIVFLTRLAPVFPFFLLNYAYGLTRVPLRHYVVATWLGIMPGSTLFVYLGSLAKAGAENNSPMRWVTRGFILLTAIIAMVYLAKIAKRALARHVGPAQNGEESQPELPADRAVGGEGTVESLKR
jgi:uncharacterized membrane protein YdjX (TVP38/TMEM64 family)